MVDQRYYEKLGGFSYVLGELKKKLGRPQTDILVQDAVTLCNELCGQYQGLPKKEQLHTEQMIFPRAAFYLQMLRYLPQEEALRLIEEAVKIGVEPDRKRLHAVTKLPFLRPLFFQIFPKLIDTMFNEEAGFKTAESESDSRHYRVDVLQCPYVKYCELLGCKELAATFCLSDDRVYGDLCGIAFQRQGTIGRGSDHCDFYWNKNNHSPRLTVPAAVVAKRTDVSHSSTPNAGDPTGAHGYHTSTSTSYYVTFQVESGDRMELGQKIIILGCPGSGKSTLAKKLHDATGLPLFHLDAIWWNADKSHISREEFDQKLHEIFQTDQWIIDGDYSRTYEMRFKSCDTVIFLDYSVDECMRGIKERIGKVRADMPWTEQELDPELVQLVENYPKNNRPVILSLLEKYPDVTPFIFKSRLEASEWMDGKFAFAERPITRPFF